MVASRDRPHADIHTRPNPPQQPIGTHTHGTRASVVAAAAARGPRTRQTSASRGRRAPPRPRRSLSRLADEVRDDVLVAAVARDEDRRRAVVDRDLRVRAVLAEVLDDLEVAVLHRRRERRAAVDHLPSNDDDDDADDSDNDNDTMARREDVSPRVKTGARRASDHATLLLARASHTGQRHARPTLARQSQPLGGPHSRVREGRRDGRRSRPHVVVVRGRAWRGSGL